MLEDRYVLDAWGLNIDFGTPTSPVASGYQQALVEQFTNERGYGWSDVTGISAVNHPSPSTSALNQAYHAGRRGTFVVNVPNGDYRVTLRLGDSLGATSGVVGVLENRYVVTFPSTNPGQIIEQSFTVRVTDSQLNLYLLSRGGANPYFALNSLQLTSANALPPVNLPPTNLALSATSFEENLPAGTLLGTLSTTDPNAVNSHTYTFVTGLGSTDNASFTISGNQLKTSSVVDYENQPTFTVRIKTTDAGGLSFEKNFTLTVLNVNEAPTSLTLSNDVVEQDAPAGTVVGTFATTDPDKTDSYTYKLVAGTGSTHNTRFAIQGNSLKTVAMMKPGTYNVRIRTTDAGGLFFERAVSVTVKASVVNQAPTNAVLSGSSILENRAAGSLVGTLSTIDPDANDTHTYAFVSGSGSTDNSLFSISGSQLITNSVLNYEDQATRTVRIKSTDNGGLSFEKAFTINVQNVNEVPTLLSLSSNVVQQNAPPGTNIGQFSTTDPDQGDSFTYTLVSGNGSNNNASFLVQGNSLKASTSLLPGTYSVRVRSTDMGGLIIERAFTVTVTSGSSNQSPTDIAMSGSSILENRTTGTLVGTLSTTDPNAGDTHTYTFISGTGSTDNALFAISGNQVTTNSILDYETSATRTVRVKTTDAGGLSYEKVFIINVQNVNEAPTSLQLTNSAIQQNAPTGTLVGQFLTTDPDQGSTFTYSFATGTGSTNNTNFVIQGNNLTTSTSLNAGSYSIRVRSTDAGGLAVENVLIVTVSGATPTQLLNKTNLDYVGAFRVPNYVDSTDEFSFGQNTIAFNPTNNSLFITGHNQSIAEVSIPSSIINSSSLSSLSTATLLQPWTNVLSKLSNTLANASDGSKIGGLTVHDGKLIGTQFAYYSGAWEQAASHFVLDSLNLSSANVHGLYPVGSSPRTTAGYLTAIPDEWQSLLGANYFSGLSGWPIISTNSSGPAAFGFDINQLSGPTSTQIPATPYLYYPDLNPLGAYTGPADPVQNGTTLVNGAVFVPGTRSILFFGFTGTNYTGYGTPQQYGDSNSDGGTGPQSLNGEYAFQVWAYDANDFIAAKQGLIPSWQIRPYNNWNFDVPIEMGYKRIGGVAFDPTMGNIYLTTLKQDTEQSYSYLPLVQVFHINLNSSSSPLSPIIGTFAATPGNLQPGAIAIGTLITLSTGNVYSIQQGTSITQVRFYIDSNNDGILQTESDQLIGIGSTLDTNHNSRLQISTSGLQSGLHTVFAQAIDSTNLLSNIVKTKFTLL